MLKKYVLKVSNSLGTLNYVRPSKNSLSRSTSEDSNNDCCGSEFDEMEVNRELFIENYLAGRGGTKARSASLSTSEDVSRELALRRNNNRRKSFMEKRGDRLIINRNCLFNDKAERKDRAVTRHKVSVVYRHEDDYDYDNNPHEEQNVNYEFIEASAPTLRKINNNLREFEDVELSIVLIIVRSVWASESDTSQANLSQDS
jgi:hypothetical protein